MLAFGIIGSLTVAFAAAIVTNGRDAALVVGAAVFLVRWLPLRDVLPWREAVVLGGVLLVLFSVKSADSECAWSEAVFCAIAVAVVTPVITLRGVVFPFVIAAAALVFRSVPVRAFVAAVLIATIFFARYSFAPLLVVSAAIIALPLIRAIRVVPQAAAIALLALWPWSGLLARSLPAFLRGTQLPDQQEAGAALEPSRSVSFDVPPGARTVIVTASGANASRLWPGTVLGRIEVTGRNGHVVARDIRIGDVADFGFMRREQFLHAHNPLPRVPTDRIFGTGATSWMWGGGRVRVTSTAPIASVRVVAADRLKPGVKLQVESIAFE